MASPDQTPDNGPSEVIRSQNWRRSPDSVLINTSHRTVGPERKNPRLLRSHPLVRARELDGHIRNPEVQGLAIGVAAVLG